MCVLCVLCVHVCVRMCVCVLLGHVRGLCLLVLFCQFRCRVSESLLCQTSSHLLLRWKSEPFLWTLPSPSEELQSFAWQEIVMPHLRLNSSRYHSHSFMLESLKSADFNPPENKTQFFCKAFPQRLWSCPRHVLSAGPFCGGRAVSVITKRIPWRNFNWGLEAWLVIRDVFPFLNGSSAIWVWLMNEAFFLFFSCYHTVSPQPWWFKPLNSWIWTQV